MATDPAARAAKALDDADLLDLPPPSTGIGLGDVAEIIRAEYAEFVEAAMALRDLLRDKDQLLVAYRIGDRRRADAALTRMEKRGDALARFDAAAEGTE